PSRQHQETRPAVRRRRGTDGRRRAGFVGRPRGKSGTHPSLASQKDAVPDRTESFDVIVIGGGVIGLAAAWRLAERGASVVVLERGRAGSGTSHVAAGMLAPVAEADPFEQPLLRLGIEGAEDYPRFISELRERA